MSKLFPTLLGRITTGHKSSTAQQYHSGMGGRSHGVSVISMQNRSEWQDSSKKSVRCDVLSGDAASDEEQMLGSDGITKTTELRFVYDNVDHSRSGTLGR